MDQLEVLERLGQHVASEQDQWLERLDLDHVRRRLQIARPAQARRWVRPVAWSSGAVALAAAVALLLGTLLRQPVPLTFTVGPAHAVGSVGEWLDASAGERVPVSFSDGSELMLGSGTRARVVSLEASGAHLVVESGRAEVAVRSRAGSNWRFSTGPFNVWVTGTRFVVVWDPDRDRLELEMFEGSVRVSGCVFGAGRPVLAGETLRAWCKGGRFEVKSAGAGGDDVGGEEPAADVASPASASVGALSPLVGEAATGRGPAAASEGGWRELARAGEYKRAFAAAQAAGFEAECQRAGATDLALLADVARYAGQGGRASQAYQVLRRRFPGTPQAATAAFALGRMAFDGSGSYGSAANWFQAYLQEQPGGGLAREALGRLMEARHRSGDVSGARSIAERYLKLYPGGPHVRLATKLAQPGARKTGSQ